MSERMPEPQQPRRHLTVAWRIPDDYGGMTGAMLRRSRGLAARGARVDVVTFDDRPDYDTVRERLTASGALGGAGLRNVYEDCRSGEGPRGRVPGAVPRPASRDADEVVSTLAGSVHRWSEEGGLVRVEHRRADGTLAVLEEATVRPGGSRQVTTFDPGGAPTGQWPLVRDFRFAWLDRVRGAEQTVLTVDSKTAARFMQHYSRPDAAIILMIHGNHRAPAGGVAPSRGDVFEHLDRWDGVVVLTDRQRADVEAEFGGGDRLAVVHNAVEIPAHVPDRPDDRLRGVVVSRLTPHKRVDHIVRVVADVRGRGVPATLEVVGDGPARPRLEALAAELGIADAVTFRGHLPGGAAQFAAGGWTMLASRSEGESLTLSEAMAAGCVPVSYDIDYGPAEAIAHGASGFLVPDGDVAAAADAVEALCRMPDADYAALRAAAREVARTRTDDALLDAWDGIHAAALRLRAQRRAKPVRSSLRDRVLRRIAGKLPPAWRG